jgi:alpha-ketoglutarate-dependent taurine dioxygenase
MLHPVYDSLIGTGSWQMQSVTAEALKELQITHLTPRIGTAIDADRDTLVSGVHAAEIRKLLEERGVLVFPKVFLGDRAQVAFAGTLGNVIPAGDEGISKISLDKKLNATADYLRGAFYWHIDGANDDVPNLAALLGAKILPPSGDGDTEWANTYAAYDDLPESDKAGLEGLKVLHSLETSQRYITPEPSYAELQGWQSMPAKVHSLVWTHRSGRRSLVLGATASHIVGMGLDEGRKLLCRLREWATQPQYIYRHHWSVGDLLIWDNTGTMHRVLSYAIDSGRLMHRTILRGEESLA